MHKRSPDSLDLKLWHNIPEWCIAKVSDNIYAIRVGHAVTEPRVITSFEDDNVKLCVFNAEVKPVLGYTIQTKKTFNIVKRDWYLSLIDPTVENHHSPSIIFKDAEVFLRKFNGKEDTSYWLTLRGRTT